MPNNSTNGEREIFSYLKEHKFSLEGNGTVTFTGSTITISGNGATLEGGYTVTSNTTATVALKAVSGNFDPSNNPLTGGKIELNDDGTLTATLSDGGSTRVYKLIPKN